MTVTSNKIGAEPTHKCATKKELATDLAAILLTLRESVPISALQRQDVFRDNIEKNIELLEAHVLMPLHMWMETNGYCKNSPKSELPSAELDNS